MSVFQIKKTWDDFSYTLLGANGQPVMASETHFTRKRDAVRSINNLAKRLGIKYEIREVQG